MEFNIWTNEEMHKSIPEFLQIWEQRPFRPNPAGMEINHSWATWFILSQLQPTLVVESGVWWGHSTWLIEQAAPDATILSFDVDLSNRRYISDRARYFEHDLTWFDWSDCERSGAVFFLDDHQDALQRMKDLYWLGFNRIIFEDNYLPVASGDFYDLNWLRSNLGWPSAQVMPSRYTPYGWRRRLARAVRNRYWPKSVRSYPDANPNWSNANHAIKSFVEMPPLHLRSDLHASGEGRSCDAPLPEVLMPVFIGEEVEDFRFNNITYVELRIARD